MADRRKVLRHHPDKKASAGGDGNDDSFFKCIAKGSSFPPSPRAPVLTSPAQTAMEVLSNPQKRREFDSVDEEVDDDDVPEAKDTTAENFFGLWAPVFEREGRFSVKQPVPGLGDQDSAKKDVEMFYDFWYSLDSWRSFEYLDKDSPEGTDSCVLSLASFRGVGFEANVLLIAVATRSVTRRRKTSRSAPRGRRRTSLASALSSTRRSRSTLVSSSSRPTTRPLARSRRVVDPSLISRPRRRRRRRPRSRRSGWRRRRRSLLRLTRFVPSFVSRRGRVADGCTRVQTTREAAKKVKAAAQKNVKKDKKAITALVTANNYFEASPSPAVVEGQFAELDLIFGATEPEDVGEMKKEMEAAKGAEAIKAVVVKFAGKTGLKFTQFA